MIKANYYNGVTVRGIWGCYSQISVVDVPTLQRGHPWPLSIPVDSFANTMTMGQMPPHAPSAIERLVR
jgi:hypothetical protein